MQKRKLGKITKEIGARPEPHEMATADYLAELGNDVLFLKQSTQQGVHGPDIRMGGNDWEIKSPTKNGKYTISHAFRDALTQSFYIIFDTRRVAKHMEQAVIAKILKEFKHIRKIKQLIIISRDEMLDLIK